MTGRLPIPLNACAAIAIVGAVNLLLVTTLLEIEKMSRPGLPHFAKGTVVKGFGRGSKDLGCPTANFPVDVVNSLPSEVSTGVYYGFAQVENGDIHKMVMSIGWNPFYQNSTKSMETHILHEYAKDFYGQELKLVILGYLRPERNFGSLDELIGTIKNDIAQAKVELDKDVYRCYKNHDFFKDSMIRM